MRPRIVSIIAAAAALFAAAVAPAAPSPRAARAGARESALDTKLMKELTWRSIGPANMGGRISSLAVLESKPSTFLVGFGTGGVFKTTNNGTTWNPIFDKQPVASIGAVAVWQKNPQVIWVGTGEANSRNSSS